MLPCRSPSPVISLRHQTIRVTQLSLIIAMAIYLIVHSLLLRPLHLLATIQEGILQPVSDQVLLLSPTIMTSADDFDHPPMDKLLASVGDKRNLSTLLEKCEPTAHIRLEIPSTNGLSSSFRPWKLVTLYSGDLAKGRGGDEFYVVYVGPGDTNCYRSPKNATSTPTAVARLTDREDGSYDLEFVAAPGLGVPTDPRMLAEILTEAASDPERNDGGGKLYIVLQYTCLMGALPQPEKESWASCGALNRVYQLSLPYPPLITALEAPTIIVPEGITTASLQDLTTLRGYDRVFGFGDSLIRQFFQKKSQNTVYEPHMQLLKNIGAPLDTTTLERQFLGKLRPHLLAQEAGMRKNSTDALIIGSGVWDVMAQKLWQGRQFHDHLRATTLYIETLRKEFPGVQLYWKSMTALHVHELLNVPDGTQIERVFYLSESRSKRLYGLQMDLMKKLKVPMLDVYPLSYVAADMLMPGDGRHYGEAFNEACITAFF